MSGNVAVQAMQTAGSDRTRETQALHAGLLDLSQRAGHDMVGPLNQAGSLLALFIKRYKGKIDSDADQLLEFLQSASVRMESVINGLRSYMEAVGKLPAYGDVDMDHVLAAALDRLKNEIAETGVLVTADPLPRAWADNTQMLTVIRELIENAIKFRNPDEPVRIHVSGSRAGELLAIRVKDNGIGIDPEQNEAVFLPFKRLNGREYPGAGMGLATVKTILEMQGGSIRVVPHSPEQTGSTLEFTVRPA